MIKLARKVLLVLYLAPLPNLKIVYVLLVNPIWKVFMFYSPGINKSILIVGQNVVNIIWNIILLPEYNTINLHIEHNNFANNRFTIYTFPRLLYIHIPVKHTCTLPNINRTKRIVNLPEVYAYKQQSPKSGCSKKKKNFDLWCGFSRKQFQTLKRSKGWLRGDLAGEFKLHNMFLLLHFCRL